MELSQKGSRVDISEFNRLEIVLSWSIGADFDLAAIYEDNNGGIDMIYFGKYGELDIFPYIQLNDDKGVGDTEGENEEIICISKIDDMRYIWILCWDYIKLQSGAPARFKESDISLIIKDYKNAQYNVNLDTEEAGNVALIATIENTDNGLKIINNSKVAMLNGLQDIKDLIGIIKT